MGISQQLYEQKIAKTITVPANGSASSIIPMPKDKVALLMGYGYSWNEDCVYQIYTGNKSLPSRTDQEGSVSQPQMWGQGFKITPNGADVKFTVRNDSDSQITTTIVYYFKVEELLDISSEGEEIILNTGATFKKNQLLYAEITEVGGNTSGVVQSIIDNNTATYMTIQKNTSVTFDMGKIKNIGLVSFAFYADGSFNSKLEYSEDGIVWTSIISINGTAYISGQEPIADSFRYIRLNGGSFANFRTFILNCYIL